MFTKNKIEFNLREELSQAEVAKIMGLTRCGVQFIENKALSKLKKALQQKNIHCTGDIV